MKLNIKLFTQVKKHILEEPRRLRQECWIEGKVDKFGMHNFVYNDVIREGAAEPPCGTIACVAGWAVVLDDPKFARKIDGWDVSQTALLRLVQGDTNSLTVFNTRKELYDSVFFYFPEDSIKPGTLRYARAVVKRIDAFIKKYGRATGT